MDIRECPSLLANREASTTPHLPFRILRSLHFPGPPSLRLSDMEDIHSTPPRRPPASFLLCHRMMGAGSVDGQQHVFAPHYVGLKSHSGPEHALASAFHAARSDCSSFSPPRFLVAGCIRCSDARDLGLWRSWTTRPSPRFGGCCTTAAWDKWYCGLSVARAWRLRGRVCTARMDSASLEHSSLGIRFACPRTLAPWETEDRSFSGMS